MEAKASQALTAAELLTHAREAWRLKKSAESQLSRLRKYRRQTTAMKRDGTRYAETIETANRTLDRVLGGA